MDDLEDPCDEQQGAYEDDACDRESDNVEPGDDAKHQLNDP